MNNTIQFFSFGCWNYDNCPTNTENNQNIDNRAMVLKLLEKHLHKYNFGTLLGDNIYPQKYKETGKKYLERTLEPIRLINELCTFNKIQLFSALGNHDIFNDCVFKNIRDILKIKKNVFLAHKSPKLRIIIIDTNLLAPEVSYVYEHVNLIKTKKDMFEKLNKLLEEKHSGFTIIMGHDPIISIKSKETENKKKLKQDFLNDHLTLLDILVSQKNVIYMCADIHNFQVWNLEYKNKNIPIFVCGTGGASPDSLINKGSFTYSDKDIKMNLMCEASPYGFCDITVTSDKFNLKYYNINNPILEIPLKISKKSSSSSRLKVISIEYKNTNDTQIEPIKTDISNCNNNKELICNSIGGKPKKENLRYKNKLVKNR